MKKYLNLIRFNKPIGTWLLFLPCLWAIAIIFQNHQFNWKYFALLFFIGSFLMRSAGCVINDILDRNFDKRVVRTKNRPIASGKISLKNAVSFLGILLFLAFLILLQFNFQTVILGFISLMFIAAYPLMKRITFYPQVFLGLTMNLGILFVSISVLGKITLTSFLIYLVGIVWTIIYDTIYGYQDLQDDLQIGVKSTSIKFGEKPQRILFSLALVFFAFLMILGIYSQFKFPFFALSSLAFFHLLCQIKTCNFADGKDCLKKFKSNFWVGIIILIAIILS